MFSLLKPRYVLLAVGCLFSALMAKWEPDQRLTKNSASSRTAEYSNTRMAGASGDTVHVVWTDNRDGNDEIYCKRNPTGDAGTEEGPKPQTSSSKLGSSVIRGVLNLQSATCNLESEVALLDAAGRKVMDLAPGDNDVNRLAPGVYFVRAAQAQAQTPAVRKVVIAE